MLLFFVSLLCFSPHVSTLLVDWVFQKQLRQPLDSHLDHLCTGSRKWCTFPLCKCSHPSQLWAFTLRSLTGEREKDAALSLAKHVHPSSSSPCYTHLQKTPLDLVPVFKQYFREDREGSKQLQNSVVIAVIKAYMRYRDGPKQGWSPLLRLELGLQRRLYRSCLYSWEHVHQLSVVGEGHAEETPQTKTHRNATKGGEGTMRVAEGKVQEAERHGRGWRCEE